MLHHLGHGDLIAQPDVARFTDTGVEFADGTTLDVDLVILATGYTTGCRSSPTTCCRGAAGGPSCT